VEIRTDAFRALAGRLDDLERQVKALRQDSACRDALIRAGQAIEHEVQATHPALWLVEAGRAAERARRARRGGLLRLADDGTVQP
jgi:hypothetical protein